MSYPVPAPLVHHSSQRTDKASILSVIDSTHTACIFRWTNLSSANSIFRLVYRRTSQTSNSSSPSTTVGGNSTKTYSLTGLLAGEPYYVYLQRYENNKWVNQATTVSGRAYLTPTTKNIQINTSVSSKAVVLTWNKSHTATYKISIYDDSSSSTTPVRTIENSSVTLSGSTYSTVIGALVQNKTYRAVFSANEAVNSSGSKQFVDVGQVNFDMSKTVSIQATDIKSSYVTLAWDGTLAGNDELDGVGEFKVTPYDYSITSWGSSSGWLPDTTKTHTFTGLKTGNKYQFRLYRLGVDGSTVYQHLVVRSTLTTDLELKSPTAATRAYVKWNPVYSGAQYVVKYRAPGVSEKTLGGSGTSALEAKLTNLVADKAYTIDLYVVENNQTHLVSTLETDTQIFPPRSVVLSRYTSILMSFDSPEETSTSYYFRTDIKGSSGGFAVSGTETATRDVRELSPGVSYKITLYRHELGAWILQPRGVGLPTHITQSTLSAPSVSVSIGASTAMLKWDQGYATGWYQVEIFSGSVGGGGSSVILYQDSEISGSSSSPGNERSVIIPSLLKDTAYHFVLSVKEPNRQGTDKIVELKKENFKTSARSTLVIEDVFASYVDLSWVPGDVQEEDGVAEFRIRKAKNNGAFSSATDFLPHTVTTQRLSGLSPGTPYKFALNRLGLDGKEKNQVIVSLTTKGSTLQVNQTGSTTMNVSWSEVYPGAQYRLTYTELNGVPVTFGGGSTSNTSALLTGLQPDTMYTLMLYVIEDGTPVGVAVGNLGSGLVHKTRSKTQAFVGLLSVVLLVLAILMIRMRK